MGFDITCGKDYFPVTSGGWIMLATISEYIAPHITWTCRYWYSNSWDGLNADSAHKLGAALQCALDNGSIDKLAHKFFARELDVMEDLMDFTDDHRCEREREYVNIFVREVKRWIEFLERCDGFTIS